MKIPVLKPLTAVAAVCAGLATTNSFAPHSAFAQPPTPEGFVCMAKTDSTGGRMRFAVRESDEAAFASAGFSVVNCPGSLNGVANAQERRCEMLREQPAEGQAMVADLMGLSIEQMCGATDDWVADERVRGR